MNSRHLQYLNIVLAAFLGIAIFTSTDEPDTSSSGNPDADVPQIVKPVDLDREFDFAGEPLPMDNFDVRERLDRELLVNTYWHSSTLLNLKNTSKFFPMIEEKLAAAGIPEDFKYLAVAESSLRNVVSPAGARGLWQIMSATAKEHGLEVNREVDERYHYEKATEAACKVLNQYHKKFGSWTMAAAAYNTGYGNITEEIATQRAATYYDLNLNAETARYIFRLVAIKEILTRPDDFGFYLEQEDGYPPLDNYKTIAVTSSISNLGDFAIEHGTTYRMLKVYNPWLIDSRLTVRPGQEYEIRIPG
ncbi:MAG: lytic transglycosylase domain-containing protein [Mameliella sp.]|nr:lytic transglycosylase domain-containing protein [Phaeodactylibacter sp.]